MFWLITERIVHVAWVVFFLFVIVYMPVCVFAAIKMRKDEEANGAVEKEESLEAPTKEAYDNLCNDYDLLERQYNELLDVCTTASTSRDIYRAKLAKVEEENERLCEEIENMVAQLRAKTDG